MASWDLGHHSSQSTDAFDTVTKPQSDGWKADELGANQDCCRTLKAEMASGAKGTQKGIRGVPKTRKGL